MTHEIHETRTALDTLAPFMPQSERFALVGNLSGEESQYFIDKICEMADLVSTMPETYGQDGKGDQAIVYLHYFRGAMDWYITEKDSDPDGDGQIQAFGLADLGEGYPELGYISIAELVANDVELDLYFSPKTLAAVGG